jgi:ribosome biogenesis GTPase
MRARVIAADRGRLSLSVEGALVAGVVPGRLRLDARPADLPVAGDWVSVRLESDLAVVEEVLPRKTVFSRKAAGRDEEQVVAANVDSSAPPRVGS